MDKPTWNHDCDKCRFLGSTIGGGRIVDCYVCNEAYHAERGTRPSLVARFGNDGPDYYSSHVGMTLPTGHAELWAADSMVALPHCSYRVERPESGWRTSKSFTEAERKRLWPIAETLAMLDGNAFFVLPDGTYDESHIECYLPQASALYEANGGNEGWAGEARLAGK